MKLSASYVSGLKYRYSKMALGITGEHVAIKEISPGELGVTCAEPIIYLGFYHEYMKDLDKKHTVATIDGVFSHEIMHRLLSDFKVLSQIAYKPHARILQIINNIMEDNYIEHCAPLFLGTSLIKSLNYMRNVVYEHSRNIEESATPFEQFINASIQYGDGGLLRGHFTSKEAEKIFFETLPIVDAHMEETDSNQRLKMAIQVMDMAKPLWEEMEKNAEMMSELLSELEKRGKGNMDKSPSSSKSPKKPDSEEMSELRSSSIMKKRKKTVKSGKEDEESKEGGSSTSAKEKEESSSDGSSRKKAEPSSDGSTKETTENSEEKDSGSSKENSEPDDGSDKGGTSTDTDTDETSSDDTGEDNSSESSSSNEDDDEITLESDGTPDEDISFDSETEENSDSEDSDDDADKGDSSEEGEKGADNADENGAEGENCDNSDSENPDSDDNSEDFNPTDEETFTDEDADRVLRELETAMAEKEVEERKEEATSTSEIRPTVKTSGYKDSCKYATCGMGKIYSVTPHMTEVYKAVVDPMQPDINSLSKSLQRIFKADTGSKCYRTSGKVSVPRLASGTRSARVFTRKKAPNGLKDMHVVLLVDESGSTSTGGLYKIFQQVTIGLAETFAKLKIPVSVIGFEADDGDIIGKRKDVIHRHYISGKNTLQDRCKLLQLTARNNNFDGYSIRYAGDYLRQINAEHKLLIVISDGIPLCNSYRNYQIGIRDTKQAIQEVSKYATVFGILAGTCPPEVHREMYGYHFLRIKNTKEMFAEIGKVIQKEVKNWE